jgi:hypothetical protein
MLSRGRRVVLTGALLALTLGVAAACTRETPEQAQAYCKEWKTWNPESPSPVAISNC